MIYKADHDAVLAQKQGQIDALRHELEQLNRLLFASKSERLAPASAPEQITLWDEGADAGAKEVETSEEITYSRRKRKPHSGRTKLPYHLPVEEVVLELETEPEGMKRIGEKVTDTFDYRPGKLVIIRRIRPNYARKEEDGSMTVVFADLPHRPID